MLTTDVINHLKCCNFSSSFFSVQVTEVSSLQISGAATREGAKLLDHWFIGHATYVVCEDVSVKKYVGHSDNIVTVRNTAILL